MITPNLSSRPEPRAFARRSGETPVFFGWCHKLTQTAIQFCFAILTTTAIAQSPAPLPPNYKTILENQDLLVMHVHYGPHEFVPMHDHSAYPTVYVYLNDSGIIRIDHAPPTSFSAERPPTHTGAFRVAPGMTERHSITNLSNIPSDFLRVELKAIPPSDLKKVFRGELPSPLLSGTHTEFQDVALRIDRIVCTASAPCSPTRAPTRSLFIAITPIQLQTAEGKRTLQTGDVEWLPADADAPSLSSGAQALRIALLYPQ